MISSFFTDITAFIAAHPHLAYAAVLLLALSESIPVIGVFVPGTAAILAISALVPSGTVTLWPVLGAATIGAIIGDGLSFWLGHRYHREILTRWPLNRYPELVTRSEAFFARHGDKSVFIARFTPGVRAFVPLIAGMLRMPVKRFYAANILSALVWAPAHVLPAVFVGAAFSMFGAAARPLAILVVLIVVAVWAAGRLVRLTARHGPALAAQLSGWLQTHAEASRSRWGRFVLSLLDPAGTDARGIALLALVVVASAWLFFGVLEDVISGAPLVRADTAIFQALQDLRTPPGDAVMLVFTELGDTIVVVAMTAAVFLWLAWQRAGRMAAYWLVAIAGASTINTAIKVALYRPRPTELFYTGWSAFSFPSGHSTVNLVLYGFLAFLIGRGLRAAWRIPVMLVALCFALLIAFSRLYLGAHWFSDVIGGLAFGTTWIAILAAFYLRKNRPAVGALGLTAVAVLTLALAGGTHVVRHHALDVGRYAQKPVAATMAVDAWWSGGWQTLPAERIDMTGEIEEPLTIQWAGEPPSIERQLLAQGWRQPAPWLSSSAFGWLTPSAAPADLPVMTRLASGRLPALTLVHADAGAPDRARFVLRLWPVDVAVVGAAQMPVFVGSVVKEDLDRHFAMFTSVADSPAMDAGRDLLAAAFPEARRVMRPGAGAGVGVGAGWDGGVLLMRPAH